MKFDVNQEVTSRLRFEPIKPHNFCIGSLENVEFSLVKIDDDKEWEFKGLEVPRLAFHFNNLKLTTDDVDRFFSHSELPVARVKKDGKPSEDSKYTTSLTRLWGVLIHIYNAYKTSPNYRPLKNEDFPEFTDKADSSPEIRNAEFITFFKTIYKYFVGDEAKAEKPVWIGADGQSIPMTMKLIATDGKNGQYLDFPKFVGEGFIQPYTTINGVLKTTLRFRPSETVTLAATSQPVAAGTGAPSDEDVPEEIRKTIRG